MANAKLNIKIFSVFFNRETPTSLILGFIGETPMSLLMVPSLERAYHLARDLDILSFAVATSASLIILFEHSSQAVSFKTPHYLAINMKKNFKRFG